MSNAISLCDQILNLDKGLEHQPETAHTKCMRKHLFAIRIQNMSDMSKHVKTFNVFTLRPAKTLLKLLDTVTT